MTKTTKTTLGVIGSLVIGILNLIFLYFIISSAFFIGCCTTLNSDSPLSFTQEEVEAIGKDKANIIFVCDESDTRIREFIDRIPKVEDE